MKSVQFFPLIIWYSMFWIKILIVWEKRIDSGPMFYMSRRFFWAESLQKTCLYVHEKLQRNPSVGSCLNFVLFFDLMDLTIWEFWQSLQGCDDVKNSMGYLQAHRLMAWTSKSPIRGNHWVSWGCRAHLGSVKRKTTSILFEKRS